MSNNNVYFYISVQIIKNKILLTMLKLYYLFVSLFMFNLGGNQYSSDFDGKFS